MKIVFFGTTEFSAKILETLVKDYEVLLVLTQADKPVGRKQELQQSPVSAKAAELNLKTLKPESLKDEGIITEIKKIQPDFLVVVAYGKIIPQNILDIPAKGSVNIHGSVLPFYRGASPIHAAILNGEKETGISIMLMDEKMDHGPVLAIEKLEINPDERFEELEKRLADLAAGMINQTIRKFAGGEIQPQEQDHDKATFCKMITKEDGKIDWNKPAKNIYNMFRAYSKWPGIWTTWNNQILKLTSIKTSDSDFQKNPGDIVYDNNRLYVQTGNKAIEVLQLQLEGKKNLPVEEFLRGQKEFIDTKLI